MVRERQQLDDKLHEQKALSSGEERRMIELDEAVEALDGAVEYKNDLILGKQVAMLLLIQLPISDLQVSYDSTYHGDDVLMKRLVKLGLPETRAMLHRSGSSSMAPLNSSRYFVRVLDLRMEGRRMEVHLEEVEEQYTELGRYTRDLAHSLQRTRLEGERKLVQQQRDLQGRINMLVAQVHQQEGRGPEPGARSRKELEKEVAHYKRLCKELQQGEEEEASRPASVVSHIQPGHIEQFQRRLAKLQR